MRSPHQAKPSEIHLKKRKLKCTSFDSQFTIASPLIKLTADSQWPWLVTEDCQQLLSSS